MPGQDTSAPQSYGPEPSPSPGWHVVPDIGEHDPLRKAYEAGNGYALVLATMHCAGYVLPAWIAEAWETISSQCMSGALTWNKALAVKAADGHKVKSREHRAEMQALLAIQRYRQHRLSVDIQRQLRKAAADPLQGLSKESDAFAAALGKVMQLSPRTALDVYNRMLPKAEHYPAKGRKRVVPKDA